VIPIGFTFRFVCYTNLKVDPMLHNRALHRIQCLRNSTSQLVPMLRYGGSMLRSSIMLDENSSVLTCN
jgi:hypothetical protein